MSRETMAFNRPPPPLPPHDPELRITIERMADYVAQYGPEGEEKARQEHHGNPQFEFLFGGKFADYYQYSIHMSAESRRGPQVPQPAVPPLNTQQAAEVEQITSRIEQLRREINESEMNLKAQEDSMPMKKEAELSKQVSAAENEKVAGYLANAKLDVSGFDEVLYLLNSPKASKDAIHSTKKWIFDNCTTDQQREVILMFLLNKVKDPCSNDCFRLNILYLINDWAYHCQRKKQDPVTQMLSRYVPQMYAFTVESSNDPAMQPKLEKLIGVWEGHKYFNDQCFKQLRNPAHIYQTAKTAMFAEHSKLAANIDVQFQALFAGYQQQHTNFVHHNQQQINSLESQLYSVKHGSQMPNVPPPQGPSQRRSRFDQQTRQDEGGGFGRFFPTPTAPTKGDDTWRDGRPPLDKPPPDGDDIDGHPFDEDALIPQAPYYALPAGIMVPQMPFENLTYGAIDPSTLRMPPPLPPSQRLIDAMDAFYTRPVNFDPVVFGPRYEQDMLADFFDRKLRLKKIYEEKLKAEGKTLDDVIVNKMSAEDVKLQEEDREAVIAKSRMEKKKEAERRRRSTSSTRGRSHSRSRSRSRSRRRSRSSSYSSSRSSSRSSRSKTRSPVRRSRSRSASPRRTFTKSRSPTPPMFGRPSFNMPPAPLGGDNKGAMLMQKMGWSGKGLGAQESGITEPVHAGEVRDRSDMFKGLGSKADPYEQFRKMRSGSYRDRNVAAAEERDRLRKEYM